MSGAGVPDYGPVPVYPRSSYAPADDVTDPNPFSLGDAAILLTEHGWTFSPGGTDVCANAGTAPGDCGAGIPAGTSLAFPLVYGTDPAIIKEMDQAFAAEAEKVGIKIPLSSSSFDYIVVNDNDISMPANDDKWAMEDYGGFAGEAYPTTFGIFNSTGLTNAGGYDDPAADKLILGSVLWKKNLSGTPASFESLTQGELNPELWYLTG